MDRRRYEIIKHQRSGVGVGNFPFLLVQLFINGLRPLYNKRYRFSLIFKHWSEYNKRQLYTDRD